MKIQLGQMKDSKYQSVYVSAYSGFIAFDMQTIDPGKSERIASNITVEEAKRIRKELKAAIKSVEVGGN